MQWQPPQLWQIVVPMCVPPTVRTRHSQTISRMPSDGFCASQKKRSASRTDLGGSARAKNPATSHEVSNVWVDSKRGNKCSEVILDGLLVQLYASDSAAQLLVASLGACLDSSTRPMSQECPEQSLLRALAVRQTIHPETPIILGAMPSSRFLRVAPSGQSLAILLLSASNDNHCPVANRLAVFASERALSWLGGEQKSEEEKKPSLGPPQ